jgi:hypothetical protein
MFNSHPLLRVMNSTPIDMRARIVTSQRRCVEVEASIDKEEIVLLVERLMRKIRLLKVVLSIENKRQHKNVIARFNAGTSKRSKIRPRRAVAEYVRIGLAIQNLNVRLQEIKKERKLMNIANHRPNQWTQEQKQAYRESINA